MEGNRMSVEVADASEKLVAEQAMLVFRASKNTMYRERFERGLEEMEDAVVREGRGLMRTIMEQVTKVA